MKQIWFPKYRTYPVKQLNLEKLFLFFGQDRYIFVNQ